MYQLRQTKENGDDDKRGNQHKQDCRVTKNNKYNMIKMSGNKHDTSNKR